MNLINQARIEAQRSLFAAGHPYVGYPQYYASNWPEGLDEMGWAIVWTTTGDEEARQRALAFHAPYYGLYGNYRQVGIKSILMYDMFQLMGATSEQLEVLGRELKDMMTSAIHTFRHEDADERIVLIVMAALMDERFGTSYKTASEKVDINSPYYCSLSTIPQAFDLQEKAFAEDGRDGCTSESIGYMLNTYGLVLPGVAGLKDRTAIRGFDEWVPKFAKFLLCIQSADCNHVLIYGDAQEPLNEWYQQCLWYRLPLLWLMVGIGADSDGKLADLAVRFAENRAGGKITEPRHLHQILNLLPYIVTDFTKIPLEGPRTELDDGVWYFHPGITISRKKSNKHFWYFIGTCPIQDDHDAYAGGGSDHRLYVDGGLPVNRPGGYSIHWTELNGAGLRGHSFLYDRGTDVSEVLPDGRVHVRYHQRGPMPAHVWGSPPLFDFVGHEWYVDIYFHPDTFNIDVEYTWKHDGNFPTYPQFYYPWMFEFKPFESQLCASPSLVVNESGKTIQWVSDKGQTVNMAFSGEEEIAVVPYLFRDVEYFKRFRTKSSRNVGSHKYSITLGDVVDPPLPPPPEIYGDEPVPDDQLPTPANLVIVDNLSLGYHTLGRWIRFPGQGVDGNVDYAVGGDGTLVAIFRAKVTAGKYNLATTWMADPNRATNSPFTVKVGNRILTRVEINQEAAPNSFVEDGIPWQTIADITVDEDCILEVHLDNKANDYVIADAVRFERLVVVPPPPPIPELKLPISFHEGTYIVMKDAQGEVCLVKQEHLVFEKD